MRRNSPVSLQEITGAVINSRHITNDMSQIEAALLTGQYVEFVKRDDARCHASWGNQKEWTDLAKTPALFVIVDGVRYRRSSLDASVDFEVATTDLPTSPAAEA